MASSSFVWNFSGIFPPRYFQSKLIGSKVLKACEWKRPTVVEDGSLKVPRFGFGVGQAMLLCTEEWDILLQCLM